MLISSWLKSFRSRLQDSRRIRRRPAATRSAAIQSESLENRALLTNPLFTGVELPRGVALLENETVAATPAQLTLNFNLGTGIGQELDPLTINANTITVLGAGNDGAFDTVDDFSVPITNISINPIPNQHQVVFQFGQQLLTGAYRITMEGDGLNSTGGNVTPIRNQATPAPEVFNNGVDETFDFNVDLPDPSLVAIRYQEEPESFLNVDSESSRTILDVAPRELTLQFNPGQEIDGNTISADTILVRRAGEDGLFGTSDDSPVAIGYVGMGDNNEEVVLRFAENLIDDVYRITLVGSGTEPIQNIFGEVLNGGVDSSFDFELDLAARIVAIEPQPVSRNSDGTLTQHRDQVVIYFNDDELSLASAQNRFFYQLIFTNDTVSNDDDVVHFPDDAAYDSTDNKVTLTFSSDIDALSGSGTYRLRVGNDESTPLPPAEPAVIGDPGDSFDSASTLVGTLAGSTTSYVLSSSIDPQPFPFDFPGNNDEPGHRQIEAENHYAEIVGAGPDSESGTAVRFYNFKSNYGEFPVGNPLDNRITELQKERTREIFEYYGVLLGIDFVETEDLGMTIVTGLLEGLSPAVSSGPGGTLGLASPNNPFGTAVMDQAEIWNDLPGDPVLSPGEFSWFQVALHEIGHLLGLGHAGELPQTTTNAHTDANGNSSAAPAGINVEPDFPGDHDIVHGQLLYRTDSNDVDLYQFEVADAGLFTAEVLAERLANSSLLDSQLRLYLENPDGSRELISQNDDYFSEDSFIELNLAPGTYYVGVSSTGNDAYDPTIAGTGFGGTSQGQYELRLNFRPDVTNPANALVDVDNGNVSGSSSVGNNTIFDGDGDGIQGGVYNFWFRATAAADTLLVDKATVSHLSADITNNQTVIPIAQTSTFAAGDQIIIGSEVLTIASIDRAAKTITVNTRVGGSVHALGDIIKRVGADGSEAHPFGTIDEALQASVAGQIVRIVGNDLDADGHLLNVGGELAADGSDVNDLPYQIGVNTRLPTSPALEDGQNLLVPQGVTVMIDKGAIFKMRSSAIGVGSTSSSSLADRSGGALQVLGVPDDRVIFTSWEDETIAGDTTLTGPTEGDAGEWGGIFFRHDIDQSQGRFDYQQEGIFLNHVGQSEIFFAGGVVIVDSNAQTINPIFMSNAQPTLTHNLISNAAGSALSANPDSFEEITFHSSKYQEGRPLFTSDYTRVGPDIGWNVLTQNSTNGLFIRVKATTDADPEKLTVPGRFDDRDVVHVIAQNLEIQGTPGGLVLDETTPDVALATANLTTTPGTSVWAAPVTDVRYRLVFVDRNGFESPTSAEIITPHDIVDLSNDAVALANLPVAVGATYVGRRLYRSDDGGTTYSLVAQLDRGTRSYLDRGVDLGRTLNVVALRFRSRTDGRLSIDPGVIVKLENARIETEMGAQFLAEGLNGQEIVFTSRLDDRYGAGGTFDTNGDGDLIGPLDVLFEDNFDSGVLDPAMWNLNGDVTVDDVGLAEPSAPFSVRLRGSSPASVLESTVLNLSSESAVNLEYSFQRAGAGDAPEINDSLIVEYRQASGTWVPLNTHSGGASDIEYTGVVANLPPLAFHANVQFRFRTSSTEAGADDWFIDNVTIRQARTAASPSPGDWGGIYVGHLATGSIDHSLITFGGGTIPLLSDFAAFNALEIHQAEVRVRNTLFEDNADGRGGTASEGGTAPENRFGLYLNEPGIIFVRGSQPVLLDNQFRNNDGAAININTNSLNYEIASDPGRSTGAIDRQTDYLDNQGPLIRDNRLGGNDLNGMVVRGETLTTEGVWDDTDIVHIVQDQVYIPDLHTYGGLRLESSPTESLVVKLQGSTAGFSANGYPLDITDRIGGMLHLVGQPGFPVVLTSIADDTAGAGLGLDGLPLLDTNNDGTESDPSAAANRWAGVDIQEFAHDRNVGIWVENEPADADVSDANFTISTAETIGALADHEYSGDENDRLGFQVHGTIDSVDDQDIYSFSAVVGTQVWLDIDRTSVGLDTVIDLLDSEGNLLAQSDNTLDEENGIFPVFVPVGGTTQAFTLDYSVYNSDDLYTLNALDAGMRVVLTGDIGERQSFFVRVRSSQIDSTEGGSRTTVEQNTGDGLTTGVYQLQIRMQELDEFPGTTIQYGDIRYATTGVTVSGQPKHSPLLGEIAEYTNGATTPLPALMNTDRGAISVAGNISAADDVDFYSFRIEYDPATLTATQAHVPVTFDLDFADGFTRANTSIAVFNSNGQLILIGKDSNIADDQAGLDPLSAANDLSRGSGGTYDPFIGPVELPTGNYTMAVFSNSRAPAGLNQFFVSNPGAAVLNTRLEPVNSVTRIADVQFGGDQQLRTASAPLTDLFTVTGSTLDSKHIVPFNLSDVNLFISRNSGIGGGTERTSVYMVDPFTGVRETVLGEVSQPIADLAMRPDGELFAFSTGPATGARTAGNVGNYLQIDTGNAAILNGPTDDGLNAFVVRPGNPPTAVLNPNAYFVYEALAYNGTGSSSLFAVGNREDRGPLPAATDVIAASILENVVYNFVSTSGAVDGDGGNRTGLGQAFGTGTQQVEVGVIDTTVGLGNGNSVSGTAFLPSTGSSIMHAITMDGQLFQWTTSNNTTYRGELTQSTDGGVTFNPIPLSFGETWVGMSAGPDQVENQAYRDLLFAITSQGRLFAFDTSGQAQQVFVDGANSVTITNAGGAVNGLAFGTLDRNLWHITTTERTNEPGHGVVPAFDNSTLPTTGTNNSLYFGNDVGGIDAGNKNNYSSAEVNNVNFPGGAHGTVVSNEFSLVGYSPDDKPALYFNYYLETENAESNVTTNPDTLMRDSFRVFVAGDDGIWHLVVTNNSEQSPTRHDEFDWGANDVSTPDNVSNQPGRDSFGNFFSQTYPDVVEAFDVTPAADSWRQAKVDLSQYAGRDKLKLRFDFSTAGEMNLGFNNFELTTRDASELTDGDQFTIDGTTFEFDLGTHLTVPSGVTALGQSFQLFDQTFTYVLTGTGIGPNDIEILADASADDVTQATLDALNTHPSFGGIALNFGGGINEGESFTIRGTTFTFTSTPSLSEPSDIFWTPGAPASLLAQRAVVAINNVFGGIAYQSGNEVNLQTTPTLDSVGGTLDLETTATVGDLELQSFTVMGTTFTFTSSPVVALAPALGAPVVDVDISGTTSLAVIAQRTINAIDTVLGAGTALPWNANNPQRISVPDIALTADGFRKGGTVVLPTGVLASGTALGTTILEGESVTYRGFTFTFTAVGPTAGRANDILAVPGDTGEAVAARLEARIDALLGTTEAFVDPAAPNRVSIPNVTGADITVGGSLEVQDGLTVRFMEFEVLGQSFRYTDSGPTGNGLINVFNMTANAVAFATANAVNALIPGAGAFANGNRVSFPDLPTAADGLHLGGLLNIPAENAGNLEGESFEVLGTVFTFRDNPIVTTDVGYDPGDSGAAIATNAANAINAFLGVNRASAAGSVVQLSAVRASFGERIRMSVGGAMLGDTLTIDGVDFNFVTALTGGATPEIVVAAGTTAAQVANLTAAEINAQLGAGTAVADGGSVFLRTTTSFTITETGRTANDSIALNAAGTVLTFPAAAAVIGDLLSVGGNVYRFVDSAGAVGPTDIGVANNANAAAVADAAAARINTDFGAGSAASATGVVTLAGGLTAENNVVREDNVGIPTGLNFTTAETSPDSSLIRDNALDTPLLLNLPLGDLTTDALGSTITASPLTAPIALATNNRITVFGTAGPIAATAETGTSIALTADRLTMLNNAANTLFGAGTTVTVDGTVFTFVDETLVVPAANEIGIDPATDTTPELVALKTAAALQAFFPTTLILIDPAIPAQIVLGGQFDSLSSAFVFEGQQGITGDVQLSIPDTRVDANEIALLIRQALANEFSIQPGDPDTIGDINTIKGHENLIQVIGRGSVASPDNAVKVTTFLQGDEQGAFNASFTTSAGTNYGGSLRGMNNNVEGVYIDDIIIGFAERGEQVVNAPADNLSFVANRDVTNPNVPVGNVYRDILVGAYDVELRRAAEYGVFQPGNPSNRLGRTLDTNDREASVVTIGIPQINELRSGATVTISNGINEATFEFRDANETPFVPAAQGNIEIRYNPLTQTASYTGQTGTTTHANVAVVLARAINSKAVQDLIGIEASLSDGRANVTSETSSLINLTGNAIVTFSASIAGSAVVTEFAMPVSPFFINVGGEVFGDQNHRRDQGQIVISSTVVRNSSGFGIVLDEGPQNGTSLSQGEVRNAQEINLTRQVPGVVVINNVIHSNGTGGISVSGNDSAANPLGAVPFYRIVNNTIVGTGSGTGVRVINNSAPSILNNIIADFATGIFADGTSATQTIVGSNLYRDSANIGVGLGNDSIVLSAANGDPLFVDEGNQNYYLAPLSQAIDSAQEFQGDRPALISVKNPLGLGQSNILAPSFDVYGQVRGDDEDAPNTSGQGSNVFIDRGAIERVDFAAPTGTLIDPLDQGPNDLRGSVFNNVLITPAPSTRQFTVRLNDVGIGIDDQNVIAAQFTLLQEGVELQNGVDYVWQYNAALKEVSFQAATTFPVDQRYEIRVRNTAADPGVAGDFSGVRDLAGNLILPNQIDGTTKFFITLTDGENDAPVNTVPGNQSTPEDTPLDFSVSTTPVANALAVSDSDVHLGSNMLTTTLVVENGTIDLGAPAQNASGSWILLPTGSAAMNDSITIDGSVFTFVPAGTESAATDIPVNATDSAAEVANAVVAVLNDPANFAGTPATADGSNPPRVNLAGISASDLVVVTPNNVSATRSTQLQVSSGDIVIGEKFAIDDILFTLVDESLVTSIGRNEIAVLPGDSPNQVAVKIHDVLNNTDYFGPGTVADPGAADTVQLLGTHFVSDTDRTSLAVDATQAILTVPHGAAAIGEEFNIINGGTHMFRFVDLAVTAPVAGDRNIGINQGDSAQQVAAAVASVLNNPVYSFAGPGTAAPGNQTVTLTGVTASTILPLLLSGSQVTVADGSSMIGDHISVGGEVFTFVDAADESVVAHGPTNTEIAVSSVDLASTVAANLAAVLNAYFTPTTATSAGAVVTLDGVAAVDTLISITGTPALLNAALEGLRFTPKSGFNGPARISVLTEDFGQFEFDLAAQTHERDLDSILIDVTPVNDDPVIDPISDVSITETFAAPIQTIGLTGILAGPPNETERVQVTAVVNATTNVAVTAGIRTIGQTLTIDSEVFRFVDAAALPAPVAGVTDIPVFASDSTDAVALAATTAINNRFMALGATAPVARQLSNTVSLDVDSSLVSTPSTDVFVITNQDDLLDVVTTELVEVAYNFPSTSATLSYRAAPDAYGIVNVTVIVTDAGDDRILTDDPGTAGVDESADNLRTTRTFAILVNPENDSPTLDAIAPAAYTFTEQDSAVEQTISLTGITAGQDNELDDVRITTSIADATVVAFARGTNVVGESLTVNGVVFNYVSAAGALSNEIIIAAGDSTFDVATKTAAAINGSVLGPIANASQNFVTLDVASVLVTGSTSDAVDSFHISSQNDLIASIEVDYISRDPSNQASLRFTQGVSEFGGPVTITVTTEDAGIDGLFSTTGDNGSTSQTFTVLLTPANDAPLLGSNNDQDNFENDGARNVTLTGIAAGPDNELEDLELSAAQQASLIIAFSSGDNVLGQTLTIDNGVNPPVAFTYNSTGAGANEIALTATDSTFTVAQQTADAINAHFGAGTAVARENYLTIGQPWTATGAYPAFWFSTDADVVTGLAVSPYTSRDATASVQYNVEDAFGTVPVTVSLTDAGLDGIPNTIDDVATDRTFRINVSAVNDLPTLDAIVPAVDTTIEEDGEESVTLTGITAGRMNELENTRFLDAEISATRSVAFAPGSRIVGQILTVDGTPFVYVNLADGPAVGNQIGVNLIDSTQQVAAATAARLNSQLGAGSAVATDNTITTTRTVTGSTSHFAVMEAADIIVSSRFDYVPRANTGTFHYTPSTVNFGQVTVTLTLQDAGVDGIFDDVAGTARDESADNQTVSRTFTINVAPHNDSPTLDAILDQPLSGQPSIDEDSGQHSVILTGLTAGAVNELEGMALSTTVSGTSVAVGIGANVIGKSLTFDGASTFTFVATGTAASATDVEVDSTDSTQTVAAKLAAAVNGAALGFTVSAYENTVNTAVSVTTTAADGFAITQAADMLSIDGFVYTSRDTTGTLLFTPLANAFGQVTVTVTATDAGIDGLSATAADNASVSQSFVVTLTPQNDIPTIAPVPDQPVVGQPVMGEDTGQHGVDLTGITAGVDNELEDIQLSHTLHDTTTVAVAAGVNVIGQTLTVDGTVFTFVDAAAGSPGTNDIAVNATDSTQAVAAAAANVMNTVLGSGSVLASGNNLNTALSVVASGTDSFVLTNSTSIINGLGFTYDSRDPEGTFHYTPVSQAFGTVTVTVTATDAGVDGVFGTADDLSVNRTFNITVEADNDVPTMNSVAPQLATEDDAERSVVVDGLTVGPFNELEDLDVTATLAATRTLAIAAGANVLNDTITVNGVVFTYVDAAAGTPTAEQIPVNAAGTTQSVAAATATAVNALLGSGTLVAVHNTVSTTDPATTISGGSAANFAVMTADQIITDLEVDYTSREPTATFRYTPVADAFGQVIVTLTATDAGVDGVFGTADDLAVQRSFTVTVAPINDAPTLAVVSDQTAEDSVEQSVALTGISTGRTNELEDIRLTAVLHDTTTVSFGTDVIGQSLTVDGVEFTFVDSSIVTSPATFEIDVAQDASTQAIASRAAAVINARLGAGSVMASQNTINTALEVISDGSAAFQLTPSSGLISGLAIDYDSRDTSGTLRYTPIGNTFGVATVTITAEDAGVDGIFGTTDDLSVSRTINITVLPVNDAPTIDMVNPQTTLEDSSSRVINLTGITPGPGELEDVRITATIDDTRVLIIPSGGDAVGKKITVGGQEFTYVTELSAGAAADNEILIIDVVTLVTVDSTFEVAQATADKLNDFFGAGSAVARHNTISTALSIGTVDSPFLVVPAAQIIQQPTVNYTTGSTTGSVNYTPLPNAFGAVTITLTLQDAGTDGVFDTADDEFTQRKINIYVQPVNDLPTLAPLNNVLIPVDAGTQTVDLAGITNGPLNELDTLRVTVTSSDPAFLPTPVVQYISPQNVGTLTFATTAGMSGAATITVTLEDAGVDGVFEDSVTPELEQADNLRVTRTFRVATPPIVTSPTGVITNGTPLLSWTTIPGTAAYTVELFNVTEGTLVNLGSGQTASTSLQVTNPLPLGEYRLRVRSTDALGVAGLWSQPATFTVGTAPTIITPASNRLPDSTPTFSWTAVSGADSYEIVVVDDITNEVVFSRTGLTATTVTIPDGGDLPLGRYRYTITAINTPASTSTGSEVRSVATGLLTVSTPPEVLMPFVAIYDTTPQVTWTPIVGAVKYQLEVFSVETNSVAFAAGNVTNTGFTIPSANALPPGEYRARVRAFGDAAETVASDWSTVHVFLIGSTPVLLGPSGGIGASAPYTKTVDARPAFSWEGSLNGETYTVWWNSVTEGRNLYLESGIQEATFTPPEDLAVGRYRVWVQATTGTGEKSAWSRSYDFEVVTPPVIDRFGTSTFNNQPTITWNNQDRVDRWEVWVNDVRTFTPVVLYRDATLTTNSYTFPDSVPDGRYRIWVRGFATNEETGEVTTTEWSSVYQFDIGGRPTLTLPTDTMDRTPTINWTPVQLASSYEVYLAPADDIGQPIVREAGVSSTSFTFTTLEVGEYRVWVRARAADGRETPWSLASQSFLSITDQQQQQLTVPVLNAVTVSTRQPTITWPTVAAAARYDVFIATVENPTTPVVRNENVTDTSFTTPSPLASGNYRVWVRAISATGSVSGWSDPRSFIIAASDAASQNDEPLVLLASLDAGQTAWMTQDVTVSQMPVNVTAGRVQPETIGINRLKPVQDVNAAENQQAADQDLEIQSSDLLMSAWDDAIWAEESAPAMVVAASSAADDSSANGMDSDSDGKAAPASWLAGLAALTPSVLRRRKSEE